MITAIKNYLDNRARTDELFATKYANPKKSIDECCRYITGEAYAKAKNGCAVISDEEVYGMAVHYYDEENKAPAGTKVSAGTKVPSKTTKVKLTKAEEGTAMHHCVYQMGYYKKLNSLILSAKDNQGNRIETVEVNTLTFEVVQSRGVCNSNTPQHKKIIDLVNQNMHLIKAAI